MSSFINKKSKKTQLTYLSELDTINKYNLKSLFLVPSLSEIDVELPLHRLGKIKTKSQKSLVIAKALIIFFILFGSLPKIIYKNSKLAKKKKIYSLRYKISQKNAIFSFLTVYFSFYLNKSDSSNFNFFKKTDSFENFKVNKNLILSTSLNFNSFLEVENFFSEKGWFFDNKTNFNVSFIFENNLKISKTNKMIQNIYPFWKIRSHLK